MSAVVPTERLPPYEEWRSRGACGNTTDGNSTSLTTNTSLLLSYLYPRPRTSVAIATVHLVGSSRSAGCGLVKWCFSASALASSPLLGGGAEVVVLTNNESWVRDECRQPNVRVVPADATLVALVRQWAALKKPGQTKKRSRPSRPNTLMKWQLYSLFECECPLRPNLSRLRGASGWRPQRHRPPCRPCKRAMPHPP